MKDYQENNYLKDSHEAVKLYVEQSIQDSMQTVQDFISHSSEISVNVVKECEYSNKINNIVIEAKSEPKPLCCLTLFDFDSRSSEEVANQFRVFLVACGYEVINSDKTLWNMPKKESDAASSIFKFITKNEEMKIYSDQYDTEKRCWKIFLSSKDGKVTLFDIKNAPLRSVAIIERQLAMIIGAMNKTVETSDGARLNMYGCISFPF